MDLRIFVVEPHSLQRRLLHDSLQATPGIAIAGEAATVVETEPPECDLILINTTQALKEPAALAEAVDRLGAGVVLFDARPALVIPRTLRQSGVVLFDARPTRQVFLATLRLPVRGYVAFDHLSTRDFRQALLVIAHGGCVLDPYVSEALMARLRDAELSRESQTAVSADLTGREMEILSLVRQGLSNKEIAFRLGIRLGTVRAHLRSVFRKLDVTSRVGAVAAVFSRRDDDTRLSTG